jgi:predicted membrane-bound mannosyltransferase
VQLSHERLSSILDGMLALEVLIFVFFYTWFYAYRTTLDELPSSVAVLPGAFATVGALCLPLLAYSWMTAPDWRHRLGPRRAVLLVLVLACLGVGYPLGASINSTWSDDPLLSRPFIP